MLLCTSYVMFDALVKCLVLVVFSGSHSELRNSRSGWKSTRLTYTDDRGWINYRLRRYRRGQPPPRKSQCSDADGAPSYVLAASRSRASHCAKRSTRQAAKD